MFVEAEVWTVIKTEVGHAVLVRPLGSTKAVPIVIGTFEVQSIILAQSSAFGIKEAINRPMTHDLMLNLVHSLSGTVEKVEIHSLNEGIYYANVILHQNGQILVVDSRPSDALALALRAHCPIFIEESIVDEVGVDSDMLKAPVEEESFEEGAREPDEVFLSQEEGEGPDSDSEEATSEMDREELERRLQYCVENELYEEAARIRDLLKKFD